MKLIILAAGRGVRMRHLTKNTPKPMLKVFNKPIIGHLFDSIPNEITEIFVVIKYLGDQIKKYLGNEFNGIPITYTNGSEKGTAYSFLSIKPFLSKKEPFLMIYGDDRPAKIDIENCLKCNKSILCWEADDPWNHGVVSLTGDGYIKQIEEKPSLPSGNLILAGVIHLDQSVFDYYNYQKTNKELYLTDIVNEYLKDNKVKAVVAKQPWKSLSTPEDIVAEEKSKQK